MKEIKELNKYTLQFDHLELHNLINVINDYLIMKPEPKVKDIFYESAKNFYQEFRRVIG